MTVRSSNSGRGKVFIFSALLRRAMGPTQPRVEFVSWSFLGAGGEVKWPGRDVIHLSPYSAEVKNEWGCTGKTLPVTFAGAFV